MIVVLALAFVGVSGLALMANRYGKVLDQRARTGSGTQSSRKSSPAQWARGGPSELPVSRVSADVLVEGFIVVRRSIRGAIDQVEGRAPRIQEVATARERALVATGMDAGTYVEVRRAYRAWRDGRERTGTPMAAAFEERREVLERLDLGEFEALD